MILNFEEITAPLTEEERDEVINVVTIVSPRNRDNPIKSYEIEQRLNIPGARLRKIINLIRTNAIFPIIGTSQGYHASFDPKEIDDEAISMYQRADAIIAAGAGITKIAERMRAGRNYDLFGN